MGKGFSTLFSAFWLKLPNDCDSGLWSVRDCGWIYSKINDELLLLFLKAFSQVLLLLFYIAPTERNFTSKHSNLRSDKWKIFNFHSTKYRNGVQGGAGVVGVGERLSTVFRFFFSGMCFGDEKWFKVSVQGLDSKFVFVFSFSLLSLWKTKNIHDINTHTRSVSRSSPISPLVGLFKEEDNIFCLHGGTQEEQ